MNLLKYSGLFGHEVEICFDMDMDWKLNQFPTGGKRIPKNQTDICVSFVIDSDSEQIWRTIIGNIV